jgi:hypothetical protein
MNRNQRFFMAIVLPLCAILTVALSGVSLLTAQAGERPLAGLSANTRPPLASDFFHVTWTAGPTPSGESEIVGYVYNDFNQDADNVRLRITELGVSGRPLTTVGRPVTDTVPALGRVFFDVKVPGNPASFRVAVQSFKFLKD